MPRFCSAYFFILSFLSVYGDTLISYVRLYFYILWVLYVKYAIHNAIINWPIGILFDFSWCYTFISIFLSFSSLYILNPNYFYLLPVFSVVTFSNCSWLKTSFVWGDVSDDFVNFSVWSTSITRSFIFFLPIYYLGIVFILY